MTLLEDINGKFRKFYILPNVKCLNCGDIQEVKIPKGHTKDEWLDSGNCICINCGVGGMFDDLGQSKKVITPIKIDWNTKKDGKKDGGRIRRRKSRITW